MYVSVFYVLGILNRSIVIINFGAHCRQRNKKIKNKLFRNVTNIHMDFDFVVNKVSTSIYKKILPKV